MWRGSAKRLEIFASRRTGRADPGTAPRIPRWSRRSRRRLRVTRSRQLSTMSWVNYRGGRQCRKCNGRVADQGSNVDDQDGNWATFQNPNSRPSAMVVSNFAGVIRRVSARCSRATLRSQHQSTARASCARGAMAGAGVCRGVLPWPASRGGRGRQHFGTTCTFGPWVVPWRAEQTTKRSRGLAAAAPHTPRREVIRAIP